MIIHDDFQIKNSFGLKVCRLFSDVGSDYYYSLTWFQHIDEHLQKLVSHLHSYGIYNILAEIKMICIIIT